MATAKTDRPQLGFTTLDIVFMALVGVAFGAIFAFTAPLNFLFNSMFGVWGELILRYYMLPQALAAIVVRKPGTYFIVTGFNMLTQALAGNPAGFLACTGWWLVGGTGGELALWALRYKRWDFWAVGLAVAVNLIVNWPVSFWFFGWGSQGVMANIVSTILQAILGAIEGAGIGLILARILYSAGLLGGFKYAKDMREAKLALETPQA